MEVAHPLSPCQLVTLSACSKHNNFLFADQLRQRLLRRARRQPAVFEQRGPLVRLPIVQRAQQQVGRPAARQRFERGAGFGPEATMARRVADRRSARRRSYGWARAGAEYSGRRATPRSGDPAAAAPSRSGPARSSSLSSSVTRQGVSAAPTNRSSRSFCLSGSRRAGHQAQPRVEQVGRAQAARQRQHIAARQLVVRDAGQVDRHARARQGDLLFALMGLEAAHARAQTFRPDLDLFAEMQRAIEQRAGDHRAEPADGERAVDRQARRALLLRARGQSGRAGRRAPPAARPAPGRCAPRRPPAARRPGSCRAAARAPPRPPAPATPRPPDRPWSAPPGHARHPAGRGSPGAPRSAA